MSTSPSASLATGTELAARLRALARPLAPLFAKADPVFLAVGASLGGAIDTFHSITGTFEALAEAMAGMELTEAADMLRGVAAHAGAIAQGLGDEHAGLMRMAELNGDVGLRIGELKKTVGAISVLAMNAQIAAASLDDHRDDFTVFTREMTRLAKAAEETIDGYAQEQARLAQLLGSARTTQQSFEQRHRDTLRSVARDLQGSLTAVDARRRSAVDAAYEIGTRSTRISAAIGEIVMALQIGDITRQRVEHVAEALDEQAVAAEAGAPAGEAGTTCRLQAAQLGHAVEAFQAEADRITAALARLADDATAIVRLGSALRGGGTDHHGGRHGTSFLADLEIRLESTRALLRECTQARSTVDDVVGAATGTLGTLMQRVGTLHSVEVDIRLVGLNMALKCGKLGTRGAALNAIAQELRAYANRTIDDAAHLMTALRATAGAAEQLDAGRQGRDAQAAQRIEQDMARSLAILQDRGDRLDGAFATLSHDGDAVRRVLGDAAARMRSTAEIGQGLTRSRQELTALAAVHGADGPLDRTALARGTGRYTMESERAVHSGLGGAPAQPAAAAATADLEDILF